jgi:uncharacterized protein (TIGR00725 family)
VRYIAVIGSGSASAKEARAAQVIGAEIAKAGAVLVCGGLGGVMEAACKGAKSEGGTTIGILPGLNRHDANPHVDFPVATGLGEARNAIVATCADAVIAIGGEFGTLSEIAFALRARKRVVAVDSWDLLRHGQPFQSTDYIPTDDPSIAVAIALGLDDENGV